MSEEKKKTNIEIYHEKRRLEKLEKEGQITKKQKEKLQKIAESPEKLSDALEEKQKIESGQIKCKRCGNIFDKSKAVFVKVFAKKGCPACGHSIE